VKFFITGWDLLQCLEYNFGEDGYPREKVQAFIVDASSSFPSEFERAITEEVDLMNLRFDPAKAAARASEKK
jgi:hypothetical protein